MLHNSEIIIADTSCLILLEKIDEIELLKGLAVHVFITPVIKEEFGRELPSWIEVKVSEDNYYQKILEIDLDKGEASAIALALEIDNSILVIDDLKGRKIAEKLHLQYSGTFGLILQAKRARKIENVRSILEKIKKTNFRVSESLIKLVLEQAGK
jgi:predicted nucleic acid-binding protein